MSDNPPAATQLYLIRHAQGLASVQPTPIGKRSDPGLTALGIRQAERLRDRLAGAGEIGADLLLASPYRRAAQTAEIIAPALNLTVQIDDDLEDFRLGEDVEGMTPAEFRAKYDAVDYYQTPFGFMTPHGENLPLFLLRIGMTLDRLIRQHRGKTLVIVTHGGFVDGAFTHFFNLPSMKLPPADFDTLNTAITHWGEDTQYGQLIWRLYRYNDNLHLLGLDNGATINWRELTLPPADERFSI